MAWCHLATSHYLIQCGPRSMSPHGIAKSQKSETAHEILIQKINCSDLIGPLSMPYMVSLNIDSGNGLVHNGIKLLSEAILICHLWEVRRHSPMVADGQFRTLMSRQNGRHFTVDIFKCIFLNENVWISLKITLRFVPKVPVNNIPALVQIMAWRWPGDKPLSEPVMVSLLTHICITGPQWVNRNCSFWSMYPWKAFENNTLKTTSTSLRDQWA